MAVPELLKMLSLKGTVMTVDALNCQRAIAQQIVDQGGDYPFARKDNQGTVHADVSTFLDDFQAEATTPFRKCRGRWRSASNGSNDCSFVTMQRGQKLSATRAAATAHRQQS